MNNQVYRRGHGLINRVLLDRTGMPAGCGVPQRPAEMGRHRHQYLFLV